MRIEHHEEGGLHRYECWDDYGCSVVASAVVRMRDGHAYLQDINVGSCFRGRGVGTRLLSQIIADFGNRPLVASVFEARLPWYGRHGFEHAGRENELIKVVRWP